ncbi:hypothetical protein [Streptosporangium sp. NPDC051022]|uniref:hypothetical protein n=1 Tax=Streptosporangium sp. NPDC051022 TaxID=3155752 RepID=UPI0034497694
MGESGEERALRELETALDANAPVVHHRLRRFPEGTPFLWLRLPGASGATLFLDRHRWIYLSEPGPDGPVTEFAAGRVEDDPKIVVERLMSVMVRPPRRGGRFMRLLKSGVLGFAAAAGTGVLSALVMAILVAGNGYVTETSIVWVDVLAVVIGVAAGLWVGVRWWRRLG